MYNEEFLNMIKDMLGDEYNDYLEETSREPRRGFRVNPLKISIDDWKRITSLPAEKSPFAPNGFYNTTGHGIGNLPEVRCGAVYPQEPSASSAVASVEIRPGMRILDLCAAPGSKSTQIAEQLGNEGLLVANDISRKRSLVLAENLERCGCSCALVLNSDHRMIAETYPGLFDIVFCDAPCSGEGMFRKESEALKQWSMDNVLFCAERQNEILESAVQCLKGGGLLVYSTCTLNTIENEQNVVRLLRQHPELSIVSLPHDHTRPGFPSDVPTDRAQRIFPMDGGEGHFVCVMRRETPSESRLPALQKEAVLPKEVRDFLDEHLVRGYPYYYRVKDTFYGSSHPLPDTGRCSVIRPFVRLGEVRSGRFEPDHALAVSSWTKLRRTIELTEDECSAYLKGMTINHPASKGWYAACWQGMPLGWVRSDDSILKNKYPKAYRIHG